MPEREPSFGLNQHYYVGEFFTEASIEMLNTELAARKMGPDRIISVLHVPGQTMANPTPPQFRVLYRAE